MILQTITENLLEWYDKNHRVLPWRAPLGAKADPYAVWISEIMLQQTTVPAVKAYFERFMAKWPTLQDFAQAPLDDVLHMWQGLGYYSRARNLHKCAKVLMDEHGGVMPSDEKTLLALPGIGPYTAAAIMTIAYNRYAVVVDGNVERVISRLFSIQEPLPTSKPQIRDYMAQVTSQERPGDFAQAMMDLGAGVCTPISAKCDLCPLQKVCQAYKNKEVDLLPRKLPKKEKPTRYGWVLWAENEQGEVLMRQRLETGLLAKMTEVPTSEWLESAPCEKAFLSALKVPSGCVLELPGEVRHTFTHFHLRLKVLSFRGDVEVSGGKWVHPEMFHTQALPTVMKKVISHKINIVKKHTEK